MDTHKSWIGFSTAGQLRPPPKLNTRWISCYLGGNFARRNNKSLTAHLGHYTRCGPVAHDRLPQRLVLSSRNCLGDIPNTLLKHREK